MYAFAIEILKRSKKFHEVQFDLKKKYSYAFLLTSIFCLV